MATVKLISSDDLKRSLPQEEAATFDTEFAAWVIEMVSAAALHETKQTWSQPEDLPAGVVPVLAIAARRLYTNPDRFTRESDGSYSYGLDSSVTKSEIFTPDQLAILRDYATTTTKIKGFGTISTYRGDMRHNRQGQVIW